MSGISNISKQIQKSYSRVKLSRAVSQILKENNKYFNELIAKQKGNLATAPVAGRPIQNIANRTDGLRMWVLGHNITRRAVNDLLTYLKDIGLCFLPKDSRTLCRTPRFTNVIPLAGGQYWYNGIATNIRILFANLQSNVTLQLNINVDGIPLMKSSSTQFWPILGNIHSEFGHINC